MAQKVTVNTKKYYRVILEGIDPNIASPESFAIKLSLRTRTALPRVQQVLRHLPYSVKRGVDADQANKLKSVLESIGGRARLETYFVTPGQKDSDGDVQVVPADSPVVSKVTCPTCGWEDEAGAGHCSFCLEPRKGGGIEPVESGDDSPPEVEETRPRKEPTERRRPPVSPLPAREASVGAHLWQNRLLIVAGMLLVLLVIAILKQ